MRRRGVLEWPRRMLLKTRQRVNDWRGRAHDEREARAGALDLARVHRRLELLLTAVYGRNIPIAPLEPTRWSRGVSRAGILRQLQAGAPMASGDGETIFLPPKMLDT